jgi:hypothetical protein
MKLRVVTNILKVFPQKNKHDKFLESLNESIYIVLHITNEMEKPWEQ